MPFCQKQFHALEQSARCLHKNRIGASPLQYGHNLPSRACRQSPISNILKQETSELLEPSLCLRAGHPISNYMTSETATPPQTSPIILGEFAVRGICPFDYSAYIEGRLFSIRHKGLPWAQFDRIYFGRPKYMWKRRGLFLTTASLSPISGKRGEGFVCLISPRITIC